MNVEAVVLTGGASRRMGANKAELPIAGVPMAERIVRSLRAVELPVTVIGQRPVESASFIKDAVAHAGPLLALAGLRPSRDLVFVASCDLALFDARIPLFLAAQIESFDAVIPEIDGRLQPLCAVYRREAFGTMRQVVEEGSKSVMAWIDRLSIIKVGEEGILLGALQPCFFVGVNTQQEYEEAKRNSGIG